MQTYQMVFMNFWYTKHYGARLGDDFVAKNNRLEVSLVIQLLIEELMHSQLKLLW